MSFIETSWLTWIFLVLFVLGLAGFFARQVRKKTLLALSGEGTGSLQTYANARYIRFRNLAGIAAMLLLGIALLRPTSGSRLMPDELPSRNLILVTDLSKSMACLDVEGLTRFEAARIFAGELIYKLPTDRIGIVSFSGVAFPECPITLDRNTLETRLDRLRPGLLPVSGSDLEVALNEAAKLLTDEAPPGSALVLLSDGDRLSSDLEKATKNLRDVGIPLHTVLFGDPGRETKVPESSSDQMSRPDAEALSKLAESTGGTYVPGAPSSLDQSVSRLVFALDTLPAEGFGMGENLRNRPVELYQYPLLLIVGLLFVRLFLDPRSDRTRPLMVKMVLAFGLFLSSAIAQEESPSLEPGPLAEKKSTENIEEAADEPAEFETALAEARKKGVPLLLLFTGSDWSEASISFEREILQNPIFQDWAERAVVLLRQDLPRSGLDPELRAQRRELAARYTIERYPSAVFVDTGDSSEIGRLHHLDDGPAAWVDQAARLLAGDGTVAHSPGSIEQLPESDRGLLDDESLDEANRSVLHYNRAVEEMQQNAGAAASPLRYSLIRDLLQKAISLAPEDRPELRASAYHQLALLSHRRGLSLADGQEMQGQKIPPDEKQLREAARMLSNAYESHRAGLEWGGAFEAVPAQLTRLREDRKLIDLKLSYTEKYRDTVETLMRAVEQEGRLVRAVTLGAASPLPLNDPDIGASIDQIEGLRDQAETIEHPSLKDVEEALVDAKLAPEPHEVGDLGMAEGHLRDALNHLLQNVRQRPQQGGESGEDQPQSDRDEGAEDDDSDSDRPNPDQQLERSRDRQGDLQDRLRQRLGRDQEPVKPEDDH